MDEPLSRLACVPCRKGAPPLEPEQIAAWLSQVPEWRLVERDGVQRLERSFLFPDLPQALAFVGRVGQAAEAQDHHPVIQMEWKRAGVRCTVLWWTHAIAGLHRNDFIMAARTEELLA